MLTLFLEIIITKDILPHSRQIDGLKFRSDYLYTARVDEIFRKNTVVLKKLFEQSHFASSKFISPEECILIAKKAGLNITDQKLINCYVESLMSRVDTMKDQRMAKQMRFVEFLVFIARIAHEIYINTK